jgi:hypothetical protein
MGEGVIFATVPRSLPQAICLGLGRVGGDVSDGIAAEFCPGAFGIIYARQSARPLSLCTARLICLQRQTHPLPTHSRGSIIRCVISQTRFL